MSGAPPKPLAPGDLPDLVDVSRETLDRLQEYLARLTAWNVRINLVGRSTLADPWRRHILDALQLIQHFPAGAKTLVDLGSGAGLPGLVLAIALPGLTSHLVESDRRKAAFLRDTAARLAPRTIVHARRAEACEASAADVITARALAPLPRLLELGARFATPATMFLLLEGRCENADEFAAADRRWTMDRRVLPSLTDPAARIVEIQRLRPVAEAAARTSPGPTAASARCG